VLVVEDDEEVRATVVEVLTDLGYNVLKAPDAAAGLIVIESGMPIDILFTDVVMPGPLKSPELARKARERLPNLAVLFTSGYTENSIVHGGKLDAGVELLSKPYTREALARRLRHVLDNQRQRNAIAQQPGDTPATRIGATVLLVDDDALIRQHAADVLKNAECLVIEAGSTEDAMMALQTAPVDVLVTDLHLPGASGVALAEAARAQRGTIAILFATGDGQQAARDAFPGDMVLNKPYDAMQLIEAVQAAMRAHDLRPDPEALIPPAPQAMREVEKD
jgi:CheY-like chemotaxis protein